jgi:hypothetical protein
MKCGAVGEVRTRTGLSFTGFPTRSQIGRDCQFRHHRTAAKK